MLKFIIIIFLTIYLSGCVSLDTQNNSTVSHTGNNMGDIWVPGRDFQVVSGDIEDEVAVDTKKPRVSLIDSMFKSQFYHEKKRAAVETVQVNQQPPKYSYESVLAIKRFPTNQISRGMKKEQVISLWGNPKKIEYAGNPINENEKWIFDDRQGERVVFFEAGAVDGWDIK